MTRPLALFESWRGRYADSPRMISERLAAVRPDLRRCWVSAEGSEFPAGVGTVRRHSPPYFARMLQARILVANDVITRMPMKRGRQTYVQVWHGTPIKLLGLDERAHAYPGAQAHMDRMRRDVERWDYLVSPSSACTEMFRTAFGYEGPVWETGYPRNDPLRSPTAGDVRRRVRASLGIAEDQLAVLWAPTWRDNERLSGGGFAMSVSIDPEVFLREASAHAVLLSRMHSNVVAGPRAADDPRVLDVSHVPDIADLYLAADVLVSDYSSAIYDFAVTEKPIVLFVPDLDAYRGEVRGLYFDYEEWAPGPVTRTTEELAAALSDLDAVRRTWKPVLEEFRQKFCPYDDGHATDRVVDLLVQASGV